ncbi:DNA-directed RNA polymerase II subunit RPB1-like [Tachysurus vachellii]|uniref:DNA-directed RNA polymerase II subunit RPB1-like n=1 Tax=Tachysurus vachellii TaxID=175792 RepID=UPI00296AC662|nr:DNA-directed RNA polymerase II subunit RPB1-like [Tachysurus vachellii]
MNPSPRGQPIHPGRTIRSLPHHPHPSPYPRPVPADVMASYCRFQLLHITHELITCLEQLYSPDLPEHPHLLFHIVRGPPTSTSSSQTPLANLVDQRTQTDGCPHVELCYPELGTPVSPPRPPVPPHAYIRPLTPVLASPSPDPGPGSPDYIPPSPSDYGPGSPDYSPTSLSDY